MTKRVKAGSVAVELVLDKDQFNKDYKAATRDVAAMQKQLSLEMERYSEKKPILLVRHLEVTP